MSLRGNGPQNRQPPVHRQVNHEDPTPHLIRRGTSVHSPSHPPPATPAQLSDTPPSPSRSSFPDHRAMRRTKAAGAALSFSKHSPPNVDLDGASKLDLQSVSSAISNGEDLAPFVRRAFASARPDALLQSLRKVSRDKELEIEDVCRAHYQDFIRAVDDLRSLLSDVDSLKSSLSDVNSRLQSAAGPLLSTLDSYLEALAQSRNLSLALNSSLLCVRLLDLCSRANSHLSDNNNLYLALRCIDAIETGGFLESVPSPCIRRMLETTIPAVRSYSERRISREFSDWLVRIRVISRNLGQFAIGRASAARQREEELRVKQRQAEEQSRSAASDSSIYALHEEDEDDVTAVEGAGGTDGTGSSAGLDLTPLFRAYHIHQTLGLEDRFRKYYYENRKLQLTSDFQVSSVTPFLESHQTFFAQIAGFFIVEDRVLRTGGGLISKMDVESLWETAVSKMVAVLEDQFSRMQTANHLLLVKDYVSLLGVTLRRYGYTVDVLLDVLSRHSDKYHELLLSDCRKQISEALTADKFNQMLMYKEYEYQMNILSFQLQTSDIVPAFPFVAPFSSTVPDCCRIVRSFIEDSVSFMSYGGQLDFYDAVKKQLERLLSEVLDGALLNLVETSIHGVSQAMQVAANMVVFERACDFFFRHAAQLSGIPLRMVDRVRREFPLKRSRDATEGLLLGLVRVKVDEFMVLTESVNWMADDSPPAGNEYAIEVLIFLETWVPSAQQILPVVVLKRILNGVLVNISDKIVGVFLSDSVKRFNASAVTGVDTDLKMFESFIDNQSFIFSESDESGANELRQALLEARQLINLLMSNSPENFLNPVIRQKSYNKLDYKKVLTILEKFKDSSDRLFGTFGTRAARQNPRRKALDNLIKRLKDAT